LVGKSHGKRSLGTTRYKWKNNIKYKMELGETGREAVNCSEPIQERLNFCIVP
jgi:hypothetical protein